ncbi:energy transducer TonB [Sphingomonas sp. G124]|uniref:Energy transducer TonB n=1 Tax=Sphingomonas cremea TaxID=2904799 RepID=A0A9X1QMS9_9SPHN|nr:energy transducer TonB [Sphingomonas cremea]MCF2515960.1 energy transducer TonB [Sphingomonas cremea]
MYQPQLTPRDRAATILMVVAIHVALAFALINLSPPLREQLPQDVVEIFDVTEPPPPPVIVEELPKPEETKPQREEGAASAKNIESKATPVVAPKPPIQLPIPQPIPVTKTPNTGTERTQGASNVVGPGTGAGGVGTGTGSGGAGSGTGGGGTGGVATRPAVLRGITNRDYPDEVARYWPRGGAVFIAVRVLPNGRATDCKINRSIGIPAIDQWTCKLVEERAVFRPATDANGRPIASWYGYIQREVGRDRR